MITCPIMSEGRACVGELVTWVQPPARQLHVSVASDCMLLSFTSVCLPFFLKLI